MPIMRDLDKTFPNALNENLSQCLECGANKLCIYKMADAVHRKRTCQASTQIKFFIHLPVLLPL